MFLLRSFLLMHHNLPHDSGVLEGLCYRLVGYLCGEIQIFFIVGLLAELDVVGVSCMTC